MIDLIRVDYAFPNREGLPELEVLFDHGHFHAHELEHGFFADLPAKDCVDLGEPLVKVGVELLAPNPEDARLESDLFQHKLGLHPAESVVARDGLSEGPHFEGRVELDLDYVSALVFDLGEDIHRLRIN